ncbi:hypothetical protein OJAV_G00045590 [Oryzias javanicus]|uniref:SAM domain-containing protein n=1 Tax=Oryzias javanicus TaxID=123683 RepID=A0A3S2Q7W0_ORYJA|nr:hypothetical protein OJAV_G00045590 [Oryzias javanicus]
MMAAESSDLLTFLRIRGVSEETISFFEEQKIDREVVLLMDDAQLADHLPSYGDRVAKQFSCYFKPQTFPTKHT